MGWNVRSVAQGSTDELAASEHATDQRQNQQYAPPYNIHRTKRYARFPINRRAADAAWWLDSRPMYSEAADARASRLSQITMITASCRHCCNSMISVTDDGQVQSCLHNSRSSSILTSIFQRELLHVCRYFHRLRRYFLQQDPTGLE